jgi:hypothetical protein
MNTVHFTFEDLCAFFTRYPSRLMVGLISTEGEAPEHVHQPHIIIRRDGVIVREYHTFSEINGDIVLEVSPEGKPLSRYVPESPADPRRPFSLLVDIEKVLHPAEKLQVDPMLCRARLYFRNGELYSTNQYSQVGFADVKTGELCDHSPAELSTNAGLDVEIPEGGSATLRFFNGTENFVFQSGSDYQVEITNLAEAITGDHFKYFYNIVRQQPVHLWRFAEGQRLGLPSAGINGLLTCCVSDFGSAVWEWLAGLVYDPES